MKKHKLSFASTACLDLYTDYPDNDIKTMKNVPSLFACKHQCQLTEGCTHFMYHWNNDHGTHMRCSLKASPGVNEIDSYSGVVSGKAYCEP